MGTIGLVLAAAVFPARADSTAPDVAYGTATAGKVASTACGGTWAITPAALKGKERVRFAGGQSSPQASTRH